MSTFDADEPTDEPAAPQPGKRSFLFTLPMLAAITAVQLYVDGLPAEAHRNVLIDYALIPARLTTYADRSFDALLTFASYAMLHSGWQHLMVNAYALLMFGLIAEGRLGVLRTVLIYVASAIGGALLFFARDAHAMVPLVGASGAISGLFGCAIVVAQRRARRAILLYAVLWLALNVVLPAVAERMGGRVAWDCHLGGFLTGMALAWLLRPRSGSSPGLVPGPL